MNKLNFKNRNKQKSKTVKSKKSKLNIHRKNTKKRSKITRKNKKYGGANLLDLINLEDDKFRMYLELVLTKLSKSNTTNNNKNTNQNSNNNKISYNATITFKDNYCREDNTINIKNYNPSICELMFINIFMIFKNYQNNDNNITITQTENNNTFNIKYTISKSEVTNIKNTAEIIVNEPQNNLDEKQLFRNKLIKNLLELLEKYNFNNSNKNMGQIGGLFGLILGGVAGLVYLILLMIIENAPKE